MRKKLNWFVSLVVVGFIVGSLASCGTIVTINTAQRIRTKTKRVIETETRQSKSIARKDVQIGFYPAHNGLGFRLSYLPQYSVERRYLQEVEVKKTHGYWGYPVLLAETAALYGLAYWMDDQKIKIPDGEENPFPIIILTGVLCGWLIDIGGVVSLSGSDYYETTKEYTPWTLSGTIVPGTPKLIPNYPVTLSLPLFSYRDTYRTNSDGEFTISTDKLIDNIPNLEPILRADSIRINASINFDRREQQESFIIGRSSYSFQAFLKQQHLRREKPADLVTEVAFSDQGDFIPNKVLDAGERKGNIEVTIKNRGEGPGIDVQLHLSSDNPDIQFAKTQVLGKIDPRGQRTVNVPITTSLQATNGSANILVEAKEKRGYDAQKQQIRIQVAELKPPHLTITAVEVNDKTLGNAIGNGNGIPENDETIELNVFIKNEGVGDALSTKLELVSLNLGLDVQVRSASIGTIRPNQTVKGVLRFRIPRTFEAETLDYKLRVTEARGADSTEKTDLLPMSTQRPILAYRISSPTSITNGASVAFTITPRNIGKLRARDVLLKLSARNATIVPATVDIGIIEADGSFQPQPFTVTLPRTFKASQLSLNVRFSQAEFDEFSQTENYPVKHIEPHLEIAERLVADTNGDGKIQQGEQVEFEVTVTNKGKLDALNAQIRVSVADTRVRIDKPDRQLGRLAPNYTSNSERFAFTIPRAIPAGQLPITVEISHTDFPSAKRTLGHTIHAESIVTTTETPTQSVQQQQTARSEANKAPVILLRDRLPDTQTVYSPNFALHASASDDIGLDVVQVTHNNQRLYDSQTDSDAARQLSESNRRILSFDVLLTLLEGKNEIDIMARDNDNEPVHRSISVIYERKENAVGLDAPSDVDVDIPQGREKNPNAVALVIGIGKYREDGVVDATFADRDAIAFKEYLVQTFGFSDDRVFLLTNERATYRDIDRGLRNIERQLESDGQSDVVVFYAGHGTFNLKDNSTSHYFVSYDADPNDPEDGYPLDAFYKQLSQLEAKSVTVFIDACFSGTDREARAIIKGARSLMLPEMQLPSVPVPVLASSTSNQISSSYESKRHGLFTYYLLKGMRGEADGADGSRKDREITLSELEAYTREHVSKTARELGRSQQPTLKSTNKGRVLLKLR